MAKQTADRTQGREGLTSTALPNHDEASKAPNPPPDHRSFADDLPPKDATATPTPAKAKPRRPSTALQAAAHVERILDALTPVQRGMVLAWINMKYGPNAPPMQSTACEDSRADQG